MFIIYYENSFFKSFSKYLALDDYRGSFVIKESMDLASISKMKADELKAFLCQHGLRANGKKEELIARVFVAAGNELPVIKAAEEVQGEIAMEYQAKLIVDEECLPDPFSTAEGWLPENASVKFWPMTLYPDIFNFCLSTQMS